MAIARDRYGIKPLYYARQNQTFAFGSEQKAILAQPQFKRNLNKPALLEYFTFQNIFTDQTLLKDVKFLPAGHYATLEKVGIAERMLLVDSNIGTIASVSLNNLHKQEYLEELDRLFRAGS